jgi:hypothetical protein
MVAAAMLSHVRSARIGGRITIAWSAHHAGLQIKPTCSSEVVNPMASKCRGCGAEIIWAVTSTMKRIPLDAKSEKRFTLVDEGTHQQAFLRDTYVSHFATCPQANEFRKRGGEFNG